MNYKKCTALAVSLLTAGLIMMTAGCSSSDKENGKTVVRMLQYKPEAVDAFEEMEIGRASCRERV